MNIYQIILHTFNLNSGDRDIVLITGRDKEQIEETIEKLNERFGTGEEVDDYTVNFYLNEIDIIKIPEKISEEEIEKLFKNDY